MDESQFSALEPPRLTIRDLLRDLSQDLKFRVIAGSRGLDREVIEKDLHRPGLLLSGFEDLFPGHRIQLLGNTESLFLRRLKPVLRETAIKRLYQHAPPCIIVTDKNQAPQLTRQLSDQLNITLVSSQLSTNDVAFVLTNYLNDIFAPRVEVHGTLVDVYGTGVLFTGRAGIGKSEIALDLIERGHRLVADDRVIVTRRPPGILIGSGPEMLKHFIEIRGVGIINVREIFGVRAVRLQKRVEIVVELVDWDSKEEYERLGLEEHYRYFLGLNIPHIRLPIYPGKNITVIAETIALNLHLKVYGYHAAREFNRRLIVRMNNRRRIRKYLRWDRE
ncbi:MAG: HPr(Ser) kinase/phosphatase [Calditrichota bacterium]